MDGSNSKIRSAGRMIQIAQSNMHGALRPTIQPPVPKSTSKLPWIYLTISSVSLFAAWKPPSVRSSIFQALKWGTSLWKSSKMGGMVEERGGLVKPEASQMKPRADWNHPKKLPLGQTKKKLLAFTIVKAYPSVTVFSVYCGFPAFTGW